ncbi:hypothetical protein F2Q69_00051100 [Brassica cretica]|uniref:Uncharacterized protein n=1 Tax=Brassica cretica TaxID=69181 RepID=A0A8S9Q5J7_BRACR|nr:hypothetical protein F2Q69_00051100 [Brassica cretica]
MASLSKIVDQKLGASSRTRSKLSITSESYFRISIHAPYSGDCFISRHQM